MGQHLDRSLWRRDADICRKLKLKSQKKDVFFLKKTSSFRGLFSHFNKRFLVVLSAFVAGKMRMKLLTRFIVGRMNIDSFERAF